MELRFLSPSGAANSGFASIEIWTGDITMKTTRRTFLAAAGAGLASSEIVGTGFNHTHAHANSDTTKTVAKLVQQSAESNTALMRGDINRYRALVTYSEDFTIMAPFGGPPTHAEAFTHQRMEAMGNFFKNGTFAQEVVETYGSADMVVLALIERQNVEVGGLPAQDWALRVTLVYRREGSEWLLAHRHADPLVEGISLKKAAALARGEKDETGLCPT
jgi:ketosteroid isomerase-like protein